MTDVLRFYSKSKDVKAGKGKGEVVLDSDKYRELNEIPHWRRILSNFHESPFKYNGLTYRTIEHAFQAAKFISAGEYAAAVKFSVESGDPIGQGDGNMARKYRKLVVLNREKIQEWDKVSMLVMSVIAKKKYATDDHAREVLRLTRDAQLWHIAGRGAPDVRFVHLECIRDEN